ncbi:AgmX/PglI C-terminal domain-containing protein [Archangium sp.]|uniref:AgmX/PglI C-terminal domain-containing protein n=1 Tax=Archangium sp. TaxID=1872627 RepID=UPI002D3619C6|nr:AgmX/PglI C-terminal domain-containing protein [Archangium sp.]HYO52024.1 AgmX/PglI C-terminal domain-containing protein [Archangium sp.]
MNFSCNKCQRRYSIADDKVRGKTVKVRCKNCQNVISVDGPPAAAEESTRVVSLADVERLREQDRSFAQEDVATVVARAPAAASNMSWEDEPTRTMPLRDTRSPWFVMVKNKQEGPLDPGALAELVASGAVTARSYFWQQGMPDWKRGQDIPELAGFFAPAAPPPAPPSPSKRAAPPPVMAPEPRPAPVTQSATSWQPEPPAPSQTTWQTEPAQRRPAPARQDATGSDTNAAPLGELFSDLDLPQSEPHDVGELGQEDPLAALGKEPEKQRAPAENTQYFVKKAGVHRRNPPWKIALFVMLLLAVPVGVLYALTELQVVPLRVMRVDAKGQVVEEPVSVFSPEGIGELRDLMLGRGEPSPPPAPAPKPEVKPRPSGPAKQEPPPRETAAQQPQGEEQKAVAALYAEGEKKDVGPEVREDTEVAATDSAAQSGPPSEELDRVVKQSRSAFKSCIEQALRKNPRLRDGKLLLTATVGSSGTVKRVSFDRQDIDGSPMGNCLKVRARRMVFPAFSGDDIEVEIPLVLSKSM